MARSLAWKSESRPNGMFCGRVGAVDDAIRTTADADDMVVNLSDAFGSPPDAGLLRADGLHPTLAGQKAIARRFVEQLAASSQA